MGEVGDLSRVFSSHLETILHSSGLSAAATEFVPPSFNPSCKYNYVTAVGPPQTNFTNLERPVELLSAYYCNARSLRNSLAELHLKLYTDNFNILCFSETWLCNNFTDGMLDPESKFNIYRRDRKSGWPAGGVLIFIHRSLQSSLHSIDVSCYPDSEIIAAHVYLASGLKICIACVYLPPNLSIEKFHESIQHLRSICSQENLLIATGDFNLPKIDWTNMISSQDAKSAEFLDLCLSNGLNQLVDKPTRLDNILDLILCNDRALVSEVSVGVPFGTSDHDSLAFSIVTVGGDGESNIDPVHILSWSKANWANFAVYCDSIDWYEFFSNDHTVSELWGDFCAAIKAGIDQFVPKLVLKKSFNSKRKFQTKTVRKLSAKKQKLWRKRKNKNSAKNKQNYKAAAKNYKRAITQAHEASELKLVNSNNLGEFYKQVNRNSVHATGVGPLKSPAGELVLTNSGKAELLNSFFVSVCTTDNGTLPPLPAQALAEEESTLDSVTFRTAQTKLIMKRLKNKTSSGPDGLPPILFKNLANQLAHPLTIIFNIIMQAGEVPHQWKQANVVPIFKKGSSAIPKNYRPISLTCVGSKIFETAIKLVLVPFLEGKNLISQHQHGFRPKHSTCLNLLESLNDWTENLDSRLETFVAHVDFARAFDSVSIPKLIHKLKWAGVEGQLLSSIGSLLTDRTQRVKISNSFSAFQTVGSGVAQGSVLGPILFIYYINDITDEISPPFIPKLYADDLKAYNSQVKDEEGKAFNEILTKITKWADTWQLPISTEKSKWLSISNKHRSKNQNPEGYAFELASANLPETKEVIDLGVNFNSKLDFNEHISSIIAKAKQRLFLLKKIFVSRNPSILILGFKTYIIPLLEYCSQVWNPHSNSDVRRLESVQRIFTKKLPGYQGLNYPARLEKAGLCTLELRRLRADLCFCYKILHNLIDTPIEKLFSLDRSGVTRGHNWKLKPTTPRLETRLHFFSFRVVNVWNSLSPPTVDATSFNSFRALLMTECLDPFLVIKN